MRRVGPGTAPTSLNDVPAETLWNDVPKAVVEDIDRALIKMQDGLCAYCEALLGEPRPRLVHDYAIEHFHPRAVRTCAAGRAPRTSWDLDFDNLLAVCLGGQRTIRASGPNPQSADLHCDRSVRKGGRDRCRDILHPRLMDQGRYFRSSPTTGEMAIDERRCPDADRSRATKTIEVLNLNSPLLCNRRSEAMEEIENEVLRLAEQLSKDGVSADDALVEAGDSVLADLETAGTPPFYTAILSILAP